MWAGPLLPRAEVVVLLAHGISEDRNALTLTTPPAGRHSTQLGPTKRPAGTVPVEASIPLTMRQPGLRNVAVAAELQSMIEAVQFKAGDRGPGQHEIARRFGVSLTTMRAAIGTLERGGSLRSEHGLGTVAGPPRSEERGPLNLVRKPVELSQVRELLRTIQLNGVAARGGH